MTARRCPHCLSNIDPDSAHKPRSVQQLRRFFSVLRAMFAHWPEGHHFQPRDEEHLRAWVLCRSSHYSVVDVDVPSTDRETLDLVARSVEAAIKASKNYAFVQPDPDGNRVRVFSPKSIAFHKLTPDQFNKLNDDVEAVYLHETGIDPSAALTETENAA